MNVKLIVVASLSMSLLACTGARVVSGSQPVEDALVIYWWCSAGELQAREHRTDSSGDAFWDPFSPDSNDFDIEEYVPPGKVVVTVEAPGVKRQRIITHAFNQTCRVPYDGKMTDQQCSKDGFSLTALSDTFNVQENAPVYKMPVIFAWNCESPGHPESSNLVFPSEWPASCRNQGDALRLRKSMMSPVQTAICNVY